jgi:carbon-monoxide dehydrogenase small subunit
MIMAATDLIENHPEPLSEAIIREEMEGNLCRCTGYHNIVKAILDAASIMKSQHPGGSKNDGDVSGSLLPPG